MLLIEILLGIAALYSGGAYVIQFVRYLKNAPALDDYATFQIEAHTFHLGLCFILALGFLGIILKIGG